MRCDLCAASCEEASFVKDGMPYSKCSSCGFIFARPSENQNFPESVADYEGSYLDYLEAPGEVGTANHGRLLKWIQSHVGTQPKKVLDVGCGSGAFVKHLQVRGFDVRGIEPAKALYDRYLAHDEVFSNETIEEVARRGETFDLVTMFDVLEHLESPIDVLDSLRGVVSPGGYVFLSTPDAGSAMAKLWGRHWHFYNKYHLSMFSRKTLRLLCERSRLSLVSCESQGKQYPLGYLIDYFFDRVLKKSRRFREASWGKISIPLNTFEIMRACARRKELHEG